MVELMVVVTIIGVLATLAIVAFVKFVSKARETEAFSILSTISAKEENFRAQRGMYLAAAANPATVPVDGNKAEWDEAVTGWQRLGVKPGKSHVSFQYEVVAGNGVDCTAAPACNGVTGKTWWYATAKNSKKTVYINSARQEPWVKKVNN